jgi:hypothetical protein
LISWLEGAPSSMRQVPYTIREENMSLEVGDEVALMDLRLLGLEHCHMRVVLQGGSSPQI